MSFESGDEELQKNMYICCTCSDFVISAVADPGERPPYFLTKMRPEQRKKIFWEGRPPSYLKVWIHPPLLCVLRPDAYKDPQRHKIIHGRAVFT